MERAATQTTCYRAHVWFARCESHPLHRSILLNLLLIDFVEFNFWATWRDSKNGLYIQFIQTVSTHQVQTSHYKRYWKIHRDKSIFTNGRTTSETIFIPTSECFRLNDLPSSGCTGNLSWRHVDMLAASYFWRNSVDWDVCSSVDKKMNLDIKIMQCWFSA